jgi:3-oxoacyl-[acyl-carrier protein] reductase
MDLRIGGKAAIVTAASSGLGKATALELAREGVRITITARREDELRRAADEIASATGVEVLAIAGDLICGDPFRRLVTEPLNILQAHISLSLDVAGPRRVLP